MKKTLREALDHAAGQREAAAPPSPPAAPPAPTADDNVIAFPGATNAAPLVDTSGHEVDDGFLDSLRDPASVLTYTPTTDLRRHPEGQPVPATPPAPPPTAPAPAFTPLSPSHQRPTREAARDAMIDRLRSYPHPATDPAAGRDYDPTRPSRRLPVLGLTAPAASPPSDEPDEATEVVELVPLAESVATEPTATAEPEPQTPAAHRVHRTRTDCPACGHPARVLTIDLDTHESLLQCLWCDHQFVLPITR